MTDDSKSVDNSTASTSPRSTSPSRKRKHQNGIPANATFIWARDGEGAAEHPAYLLPAPPPPSSSPLSPAATSASAAEHSSSNDDNDEGLVWVQWASNGTISRIPKSNIISSDYSSRRRSRSRPTDNQTSTGQPTKGKRKSRLSLTKKQRMSFKEHCSGKGKARGGNGKKGTLKQGETSSGAMVDAGSSFHGATDHLADGGYSNEQTRNDDKESAQKHETIHRQNKGGRSKKVSLSPSTTSQDLPPTKANNSLCNKPLLAEASLSQTTNTEAPKQQPSPSAQRKNQYSNRVSLSPCTIPHNNSTTDKSTNSNPSSAATSLTNDFSKSTKQQHLPPHQNRAEVEVIEIIDSDEDEGEKEKERCKVTHEDNKDQAGQNVIFEQVQKSMPKNVPSTSHDAIRASKSPTKHPSEQNESKLQSDTPASSSSSSSPIPTYTHRSSAYVQHLAEACTLIMTDGRWCTASETPLFSWERGDDLSAVKGFMSLYDDETTQGPKDDTETKDVVETNDNKCKRPEDEMGQEAEQEDEVFERAMHLYSRMFHRKGPWFDLADLYIRYYAPKSTSATAADSVPQQDDDDVELIESTEGSSSGSKSTKTSFFTPKSSSYRPKSNSSTNQSNNLISHKHSMENLFSDILRLLSTGLIRSFTSEYECGSVAGDVSIGRRGRNVMGTLLLAEERREVLRRLGGGKKVARSSRALSSSGASLKRGNSTASSAQVQNEILMQMQSQQSVLSSFAKRGGVKSKAALLPVRNHVDKVLLRKLAVKVASLGYNDAPRKSDIEDATNMIHDAWAAACTRHEQIGSASAFPGTVGNGIPTTFRLREGPLQTLRRCLRLFLCAGGGPGAMRGDGTNGWISVSGDESSSWHNVVFPGLSSRFGLEYYQLKHCYAPILPTPKMAQEGDATAHWNSDTLKSAKPIMRGVFSRHSEFHLWELGVELRSFIDQATEAYEVEKMIRRRREKELAKQVRDGEASIDDTDVTHESSAGSNSKASICLLGQDGFALLTEQGRKDLLKSVMVHSDNETQMYKHTPLDLAMADLCCQIEADILSLSCNEVNGDDDNDNNDGFGSDTERVIAAAAVICNKILRMRVKHPSQMLIYLTRQPWLRHMSFDAILTYFLWDSVPFFERRGHHGMAVCILQTILFGQDITCSNGNIGKEDSFDLNANILQTLKVEPFVLCLLPRRNRGKACERLLIDIAHVERRAKKKKACHQTRPKKKARKKKLGNDGMADPLKEENNPPPLQVFAEALLSNLQQSGSIPFCSLRNLARRSKARLPQSDERSALKICPTNDGEWSPKTDFAVANAIAPSDGGSDSTTIGKRCAFVGWEMNNNQDDDGGMTEARRSLNVEELAMEEYHFGRLPADEVTEEEGKGGQWVGWHNEGGHVRALFRILCIQHLLEGGGSQNSGLCQDEQATVILTPYQHSPHDLHVGCFKIDGDKESNSLIRGFYERRRKAIESFLSRLTTLDDCGISELVHNAVKRRWDRHSDERSRMKDPRLLKDVSELKTLSMIACALGPIGLSGVFRTLCFDYRHWSGGLPDLFLVRARRCGMSVSATTVHNDFVDLADWVGEGFSQESIEEENIQSHIRMLADRDDEFLGQPKNADGSSSQHNSTRRKQQAAPAKEVQLPSFPDKLEFLLEECQIKPECLFVEVKSANDRLSERQEDWLSILEDCTNARVCKFTSSKT